MDMDEIREWIAADNLDAVEDVWMTAVEDQAPAEQMRPVLEALLDAERAETAETLAWVLLTETIEHSEAAEALDLARVILPGLPGSDELRLTAADLYKAVHGEKPHFDDLMKASGLAAKQTLRRAVLTLDTCLTIEPGQYLANRFDHQVVQVEAYSPVFEQYELLGAGGGKMQLDPKLLADDFEPVSETDFRVLSAFRPEGMPELVQTDPGAVLIGACLAHGGKIESSDLKELLVPAHLPKDKWTGWWNRARTAAKRSELLSLEGRNPVTICYHQHGHTVEDQLAEATAAAIMPLDFLAVLQQYAREIKHRRGEIDAEFAGPLMAKLAEQAAAFRRRRPVDALTASLAVAATTAMGLPAPDEAGPSAAEILADVDAPAEIVAQLPDPALWPAAFDALGARADAGDQFPRLLTLLPAGQLDEIASRLRQADRNDAVTQAVANAPGSPVENLQLCLWLWSGPAEPVSNGGSMLELLSALLTAMQHFGRDADVDRDLRRTSFQQIRSALTASKCERFRAAVAEMDQDVAQTFKRRVEMSPGLSDVSRETLLAILREAFYSLFVTEKVAPWLDENVNWSTEAAAGRREAERKNLMEVEMLANSRAIGVAADKGDLSENSEWQFAIEEQRRLQARASQMQDELARVRILHADDVPEETVGIGSRVTLKRTRDGERIVMSFLGPWDSDVENRIFSYQTPIAQSVMGAGLGDTVTVSLDGDEDEYIVERIESAI